ncbi:hypothetical protein HTG_17010 [Natrinema mahii]|nr:hypothetical protein HTG_17010 [Natrinema mahii]
MNSDEEFENDIVETLVRKKVTGGKKHQIDTVKNWFASSDQGRVEDLIEKLARDPDAPVEMYGGGARANVRLTSRQDAKEWLDDRGRDLWWA